MLGVPFAERGADDRRIPAGDAGAVDRRAPRPSRASTRSSAGSCSSPSPCRSRTRPSGSAATAGPRCAAPSSSARRGIRSIARRPSCAPAGRARAALPGPRPRDAAGAHPAQRHPHPAARPDARRPPRTPAACWPASPPRWSTRSRELADCGVEHLVLEFLAADGRELDEQMAALRRARAPPARLIARAPRPGWPMAVHRSGRGPDLVLFHGGMGSWKHWIRNVEPLAARFTVHALDHPSYGDSAPVPRETTGAAYLDLVHDLFVEMFPGDAPLRFAGFSFGGAIATHLARRLGPRVTHLCLVSPGGFPTRSFGERPIRSYKEAGDDDALFREICRHNLLVNMLSDPAQRHRGGASTSRSTASAARASTAARSAAAARCSTTSRSSHVRDPRCCGASGDDSAFRPADLLIGEIRAAVGTLDLHRIPAGRPLVGVRERARGQSPDAGVLLELTQIAVSYTERMRAMKIKRVEHVAIAVQSLTQSIDLLKNTFGLTPRVRGADRPDPSGHAAGRARPTSSCWRARARVRRDQMDRRSRPRPLPHLLRGRGHRRRASPS